MQEVEEELERWRAVIENKGLRISRSKTEYLVPSHQQGVVKLEGEPLPSVNSFKYLGSVIDGSGGCGKDVDGRIKVQARNQGGFGGFVRTPLFANPPSKNTNPPPQNVHLHIWHRIPIMPIYSVVPPIQHT